MDKHRLELFSDGVFVIVLTLLVLDLKPPAHPEGLAGLAAIAPGLLVHALTFFVIGVSWLAHHSMMASAPHVNHKMLLWNLLALFWVTLMPFAARIAAEHPLTPLGPGLFVACRGLYGVSAMLMRQGARQEMPEHLSSLIMRRRRIWVVATGAQLAAAPLCWVSPWIGYGVMLAASIVGVSLPPVAEEAERRRRADPSVAAQPAPAAVSLTAPKRGRSAGSRRSAPQG